MTWGVSIPWTLGAPKPYTFTRRSRLISAVFTPGTASKTPFRTPHGHHPARAVEYPRNHRQAVRLSFAHLHRISRVFSISQRLEFFFTLSEPLKTRQFSLHIWTACNSRLLSISSPYTLSVLGGLHIFWIYPVLFLGSSLFFTPICLHDVLRHLAYRFLCNGMTA